MGEGRRSSASLNSLLAAVEAAPPVVAVDVLAAALAEAIAERVPLVGTPHGRALASQAVEVVVEDRGARLFAPVTSRGEAVFWSWA
jgi:hypothetical protein